MSNGMDWLVVESLVGEQAPVGYVHLVGIHPDYRRRGVGRLLYTQFVEECRQAK